MTTDRDFDRLARAWLELGPDEAPDRVIAAVLQAADTMPQVRRRVAWPTWRPFPMNRLLVLAGTVVLLVALVGGGVLIVGSRAPSTAIPSHDAVASATPAASAPVASGAVRVPGLDTDLRLVDKPLASIDVGYVVPGMELAGEVASDGSTLWVSKHDEIVGIDPATSTVKARIPVPGSGGYYNAQIAVSPGAIWVAGPEIPGASIQALDSKTGKIVASIPVTDPGWWIYSDGSVWVTEPSTSTVIRIDAASHKVVARIRVGSAGQIAHTGGNNGGDIVAGDGSILVGNDIDQTVTRIDPKTNKIVATIHSAPLPLTMTIAAGTIWGASWDDSGGHLMKTDAASGRSSWTTDFQGGISNPLVRSDAVWLGFLASTGDKAGALAAIDPATGKVIDGLSIPDGQVTATYEAFDSVWLVLGQQGIVERFSPDVLAVRH